MLKYDVIIKQTGGSNKLTVWDSAKAAGSGTSTHQEAVFKVNSPKSVDIKDFGGHTIIETTRTGETQLESHELEGGIERLSIENSANIELGITRTSINSPNTKICIDYDTKVLFTSWNSGLLQPITVYEGSTIGFVCNSVHYNLTLPRGRSPVTFNGFDEMLNTMNDLDNDQVKREILLCMKKTVGEPDDIQIIEKIYGEIPNKTESNLLSDTANEHLVEDGTVLLAGNFSGLALDIAE